MRVFRASRGAPPTCGQVRGFLLPLSSQPASARPSPAHAALSRTRRKLEHARLPPPHAPHLSPGLTWARKKYL